MRKFLSWLLILLGLALIATSITIVSVNLRESADAAKSTDEVRSILEPIVEQRNERLTEQRKTSASSLLSAENPSVCEEEIPFYVLNPDVKMPTETIEGREYVGMLTVPALSLELPVQEEWDYPNLNVSPCCYSGTAYKENFVICAHNYESHFGNIKNLHPGDEVFFTDAEGNRFSYQVSEVTVLESDRIDEMKESGWALTLFTCTVGGVSRVTVRCELISSEKTIF